MVRIIGKYVIIEEMMIPDPGSLDVFAIAFLRRVLVEEDRLEGAQGRLVIRGDRAKVRIDSSIPEEGRKRFVVAHELGHFEMHRQETHLFKCKQEYFELWLNKNPVVEREANLFASELLMPKHMFVKEANGMEPNLDSMESLACLFSTSLTATALRFLDCTFEPCAVVCSQEGVIRWCKNTEAFGRRISWGQILNKNTYAYDFFHGAALPSDPQEVLASAWFPDSRMTQNATIQEHSLGMTSYGTVLTLLWVKDLIDSERDEDADDCFTPDGKRHRW